MSIYERKNNIAKDFSDIFDTSYPYQEDPTGTEAQDKLKKLLESMSTQMPSPYEMAEKEMNRQLEEKGLPDMKTILEALEISNPEYFL
jgi:hypothetical protein